MISRRFFLDVLRLEVELVVAIALPLILAFLAGVELGRYRWRHEISPPLIIHMEPEHERFRLEGAWRCERGVE